MVSSGLLLCSALVASGVLGESEWTNPFPVKKCNGVVIEDVDIDTVQNYFEQKVLSAEQLTQCYIDRINLMNPYLHTVIQINPDALSIAHALDAERAKTGARGPLHGIPILTKDNIGTADKVPTTAGSLALLNSTVARDAHVAALLRLAGAVLLGHANMAEFADYIAYDNYAEGYSDRGGQTRNCFNGTQQTSGSSSGSAQSVVGNLCMAALGTETDGSILLPAFHAGIVGIKPTVGRVSRAGVVPGSLSQDTVGPHARTFRDAAYVLDAISGVDARDNATFAALVSGAARHANFSTAVAGADALRGAKFGIPWDVLWSSSAGGVTHRAAFLAVLQKLEAAGATLYNNTNIPRIRELQDPYGWGDALDTPQELWARTYLHVDLYNGHRRVPARARAQPDPLVPRAARVGGRAQRQHGRAGRGHDLGQRRGQLRARERDARRHGRGVLPREGAPGPPESHQALIATQLWRHELSKSGIDAALTHTTANGTLVMLDALLVPMAGGGLFDAPASGLPAAAHYPAVTLPVGQDPWQVPFGLGLWGTAFSEAALIRYGSAIDAVVGWRGKPMFYAYNTTRIPFDPRWPGFFDTPS
ncbi:amidase signature domain-containing protein [Mycena rosella]|uniref:Amidase signature domain-containing protein n=1 Tax=Mycena rosella TaxID=1033263 RepID=A0AAD7BY86_MYCRO|nr:amidase signature domain-containing protein [Mycena rosella]